MGIKELKQTEKAVKKNVLIKIDLKGYDKFYYMISFLLAGLILAISAHFIKEERILGLFSILLSLSLAQSLVTGFVDIRPDWKVLVIGFLLAIVAGLILYIVGWEKIKSSALWCLDKSPKFPPDFVLFFLALPLFMFLTMVLKSQILNHYRISSNEIEQVIGASFEQTSIKLEGTVRAKGRYPDLLELFPPYFAGEIIIETLQGKEWIELLRVENVPFAFMKVWKINQVFNAKVITLASPGVFTE
jgi:hypothetical protein